MKRRIWCKQEVTSHWKPLYFYMGSKRSPFPINKIHYNKIERLDVFISEQTNIKTQFIHHTPHVHTPHVQYYQNFKFSTKSCEVKCPNAGRS